MKKKCERALADKFVKEKTQATDLIKNKDVVLKLWNLMVMMKLKL